jgi:hypothetical protein
MAVNPLQSNPARRPGSDLLPVDPAAVLAALKAGQTVDAVVTATLETGEARLALLGILIDIMPVEPLEPGDALKLTVVDNGEELAVAVAKQPAMSPREGAPALAPVQGRSPGAADVHGAAVRPATAANAQAASAHMIPAGSASQGPAESPAGAGHPDAVALSRGVSDGVRRGLPLPAPAPPDGTRPPSSPEAKATVAAMIPRAAAGQLSRAPLVANSVALLAGPAGGELPAEVRETLTALVASAMDPEKLDARKLREAVARSGTFQEAAIRRFAEAGPDARPGQDLASLKGDAKGAILALRSALQSLAGDAAPTIRPRPEPPALPQRGGAGKPQRAVQPSVDPAGWTPEAGRILHEGAEGALNRIRLLQAASLPDERGPAHGEQRADRLVEVPVALADGRMPVMSLAVGRERGSSGETNEAPAAWRMRLSLDLEETGPMHALVSLRGAKTGVTLWAERPETADLFRSSLRELRDALSVADLEIDTLDVRTGAPAMSQPAPPGSFLDRTT